MKICLISAPTANQLHSAVSDVAAARIMGELAPVGILSLAAVLETRGFEPQVVDLNRVYYSWLRDSDHNSIDFCRFAGAYFAARDFDFFGFSTVCSSYPLTLRIAAEVKRAHPNSVVALGGPQASVVDVATLRAFPTIDLVVRGEAELALPELMDALTRSSSLAPISGITFRRDTDGEIVRNPDGPSVMDLDALPFPAFHLFPDIRFCRHFPLELGRGCPFSCTFCSTNDFFRRRFRLKSPAHMIAEMRRVRETYGIDAFELVHDMFTVDRKRVVSFCESLIESQEEFTWGCSARTDCIDEELIALMARAGCRGIFFGIETGSGRMQKIIDKGLELNDSAERVRSCDKFKINTAVSLMAGFPEENMHDLRATAAFFVDSLRYDHADPQLSILSPLAGTPIQQQHKDSLLLSDNAREMSYRGWPQDSPDHELIAGHPEIFSSFYSVPTPALDHEFVKELRDFLLCGMRAFRRLLLGLHQDSHSVVDVFQLWRQWRIENGVHFPNDVPGSSNDRHPSPEFPDCADFAQARMPVRADSAPDAARDRTSYYAQNSFPEDFLHFVEQHYIPVASRAPIAMTALLEYEAALLASDFLGDQETVSSVSPLSISEDVDDPLSPKSRPQLLPGVNVIELSADYHEILRRLQRAASLEDIGEHPVKLAIRRATPGPVEARQLSPLSVALLDLCEDGLTVEEITAAFRQRKIEVQGVPAEKVCLAGIEILRQQRLIGLTASN
jgi:radical SAM superfamily enzyme YgiQ (UPF0313 family)